MSAVDMERQQNHARGYLGSIDLHGIYLAVIVEDQLPASLRDEDRVHKAHLFQAHSS